MNVLLYKTLWWIYRLMNSSWVVILTTLGKLLYMQISAAIIEKSVLFNIVENMHDTVSSKNGVHAYVFKVID